MLVALLALISLAAVPGPRQPGAALFHGDFTLAGGVVSTLASSHPLR